ncbi:MAG: outer membrane protein assembly factor BamD [Myxococcaceae bacterium]|nr:outer membrane protein assembly factor BamD [Myxococcaceae bacterium]
MIGRLLVLVLVFATGCASVSTFFSGNDDPLYSTEGEENLKKGNEALESKNYLEASKYFEFTRTKFPYLEVSKEAELKLADCSFEQEKYVEARDRYHNFVRLHPTHPKVDYAAFRAAQTHFRDIPSDFFLLPPAIEKDQVELKGALIALNEFVRLYPRSEHQEAAKKIIADVRRRLARHELYVAEFYRKREKWPAVVNRLTVVQKNFTGIGFDADVAFGLHDAHLALKQPDKARTALALFVEQFPSDEQAGKAKSLLARLPAPEAPAPAPEAPATP